MSTHSPAERVFAFDELLEICYPSLSRFLSHRGTYSSSICASRISFTIHFAAHSVAL
jgi:hypothetical protein